MSFKKVKGYDVLEPGADAIMVYKLYHTKRVESQGLFDNNYVYKTHLKTFESKEDAERFLNRIVSRTEVSGEIEPVLKTVIGSILGPDDKLKKSDFIIEPAWSTYANKS